MYPEGAWADRPGFVPGVDLSLAATVSARDVLVHFFLRWWVVALLTWLFISLPLSIAIALVGHRNAAASDLVGGVFVVVVIPIVAAWAALLIPLRTGNSQYNQLVDGSAGAAESAFANIYQAARARGFPASVVGRRIAAGAGTSPRNYLIVQHQQMQIWVVVMASGVDLWVAWTAWVRHLPLTMPWYFLKQRAQGLLAKGSDFHEALRLNEILAVQWAVHASVIDGVDATLSGKETTVLQAFGYEIPLESSVTSRAPSFPVPFDQPGPATSAPSSGASPAGFCRSCGGALVPHGKFCEICGNPTTPRSDTLTVSVDDLPPSS